MLEENPHNNKSRNRTVHELLKMQDAMQWQMIEQRSCLLKHVHRPRAHVLRKDPLQYINRK